MNAASAGGTSVPPEMTIKGPYADPRSTRGHWALSVRRVVNGSVFMDMLGYLNEQDAAAGRARLEETGDIGAERRRSMR